MLEVGAGVEVMVVVVVGLMAAGNEQRVILGRGRYVCVSTLIRRSASITCDTYVVPPSVCSPGCQREKTLQAIRHEWGHGGRHVVWNVGGQRSRTHPVRWLHAVDVLAGRLPALSVSLRWSGLRTAVCCCTQLLADRMYHIACCCSPHA